MSFSPSDQRRRRPVSNHLQPLHLGTALITIHKDSSQQRASPDKAAFSAGIRNAFVVFTQRDRGNGVLIRPISARYMHKREVESYEKTYPNV